MNGNVFGVGSIPIEPDRLIHTYNIHALYV
jgi:hypothetical protein